MMSDAELPLYKVVLAGETRVGKTCILNRFTGNEPREDERSTIGVEFGVKIVRSHIIDCKLQLWDTAGQQRYRAISQAYYRGSKVVVFVFDVTNRQSFEGLATWLDEGMQHAGPECKSLLLGNKKELPNREVATSEAAAWADKNGMPYLEIDAMADINMKEALNLVCKQIASHVESGEYVAQEIQISAADQKRKEKLLPLVDQLHDLKFRSIYQIYSPIIKISAPKLLDSNVQDELFRITSDPQLWHKILNNLQFEVREELNLDEISQVLQIAIILECSSLKKYAMAQLAKQVRHQTMHAVLLYMVKASFMNADHKKAVLHYLYHSPASKMQTNKIQESIDKETFEDFQIWKSKPTMELSPLLEIDSDDEKRLSPENRFFALISKLHSERDSSGDLLLKSGGTEENNSAFTLKVHRFVAAARCDFINSCLNSHLKEASEGVIEIKGFTEPELSALVEYFYTNSYSHITEPDTCISILSMASYLMLTKDTNPTFDHSNMLRALEERVLADITDDTCLDLALNAHKNQDEELKRIAVKYIVERYGNIIASYEEQFAKLPKALMFTIMNRVILKMNAGPNNNQ